MKTFVKMILPIAAFALASAGAVSTNGNSSSKSGDVQGWKRLTPDETNCTEPRMCNNIGTATCFNGASQVYGKIGLACTQTLNHRP